MTEQLECEVKRLGEECISLAETPLPPSDSIDGYVYTIVIKNKDAPYCFLRNIFYSIFPEGSPERAHSKRVELIQKYNLVEGDVIVYATRDTPRFGKP